MSFNRKATALAVSSSIAATFGLSAQAQLEEVIVTAQKKSASVTDVPITMTAMSSSDIKNLRITDAMDIEAYTTNIDIKGTLGGTNPAITIRGVGLNDFNANNNPAVGVYVDEVFLVSAGMLNFSTFDIERIEVLKGPQGTLYGRNTTGGAINYFTTKPTYESDGYVTVTAGNYGLFEAEGAYSNAISDKWAFRVSGKFMDQSDNFVENKLGDEFDGSDMATGRLALRYEGERVTFDTSLTVGEQNLGFSPFKNRGYLDSVTGVDPCPTAASGNPVQDFSCVSVLLGVGGEFLNIDAETFPNQTFDEATYANNIPTPQTETDSLLWVGRFDIAVGDSGSITSVTSLADVERSYADSIYGSLQGYRYFDATRDEEIKQFTQELRYNYLSEKLDWTVGGFFSNDEVNSNNLTNAQDALATAYAIGYEQETTAWALFTQLEYNFSEAWALELGLRYNWEERDYVGGTTDLNPFNQSVILYLPVEEGGFGLPPEFTGPLPLTAGNEIKFDDSDTSGRIGLNFRPNDNWLIYGNVSTGFKSGIVFSDITFLPEEQGPLDPETLVAYELGFKGTMADGYVQLNGAVFHYDYDDIQTQVPTDLALAFTNADKATIDGIEADINWQVTDGFNLRGGIAFLDTEFEDPNLAGNQLPNAPELQYNIVARYETFFSGGLGFAIQADAKYTDEMYREATNNPLALTSDYTLVNGRISLLGSDSDWELSLWGKNLTNEEYREQIFVVDFFGITGDLWNTPRTYGASLTYNF